MAVTIASESFSSGFTNNVSPNGIRNIVCSNQTGSAIGGIVANNAIGYGGNALAQSGWGLKQTANAAGDYAYWNLGDGQNGEEVFSWKFWRGSSTLFAISAMLRIQAFTGVNNAPNTYYRLGFSSAASGVSKAVLQGASPTSLMSITTANTWLPANTWVQFYAIVSGTSQTILRLQVQRLDDMRWLRSDGNWYPCVSPADLICWVDSSSPITGSGVAGLRFLDATGFTAAVDDISYTAGITCGNLVCAAKTDTSISVRAGAATYGVAPYSVQYQSSPHGAGSWTNLGASVPIAAQSDLHYLVYPILANLPAASSTQSGLTPNTAYDYRAVLTDANGLTDTSPTLAVTTLANAPRGWYFAASGNDVNPGTIGSPKSNKVSTINGIAYNPGDTAYLNGGDSFGDGVNGRTIRIPLSGQQGAPITITSYGTGNAILTPDDWWAIQINDQSYWTIKNLTITARPIDANGRFSPASPTNDNLVFGSIELNSNATTQPWQGITIQNISVTGGKAVIWGEAGGGQARGAVIVNASGTITGVMLNPAFPGYGYSSAPTATIASYTNGAAVGSGGSITTTLDGSGFVVPTVASGGTGYDQNATTVGFANPGTGATKSYGYANVLIENVTGNTTAGGICFFANRQGTDNVAPYRQRDCWQTVIVRNCSMTQALGQKDLHNGAWGAAFYWSQSWNLLFENCFGYQCGTGSNWGNAGIWGPFSDVIYHRGCGVEGQNTTGADGAAYDADYGTTRIMFNQCWSHGCKGAAWMVYNDQTNAYMMTGDITYMNCISVNDMQQGSDNGIASFGGSNIGNANLINCTAYLNATGYSFPVVDGYWNAINNVLIVKNATITPFFDIISPFRADQIQNNDCYDLSSPGRFQAKAGTTIYNSVASFTSAGAVNVYTSDPQVANINIDYPGSSYVGILAAQNGFHDLDPASATSYVLGKGTDPFLAIAGSPVSGGPLFHVIPTADFHGVAFGTSPSYPLGAVIYAAPSSNNRIATDGGTNVSGGTSIGLYRIGLG